MPKSNTIQMEVVMRFKTKNGALTGEYIFREGLHHWSVECIEYWPSGIIRDIGVISLDEFIEGVHKIQQEKANELPST